MKNFPAAAPDFRPDQIQFAKEVADHLGCKDPLTRKFILVCFVAIRVFDWKQSSYGCGNIQRAGTPGVVTRIGDKCSRLENLMRKGESPEGEPLEDTFGDVGNYGFIGLMCRWGLWPGVVDGRAEQAK